MSLAEKVTSVFRGKKIVSHVPGYSLRSEQIEMAEAVADLIDCEGIAVYEAGTGVGKSFAYLIPAILSGQSCVISTATLTLQDQLLDRDIPAAGRILGETVDAAVLKGRSNYLCLRKWLDRGASVAPHLRAWAEAGNGDLSHLETRLAADVTRKIAADGLDCLGSNCSELHRCHYYTARSSARKARILVVNHHLLLSGLVSGDLIPEGWFLVVDEAHSLDGAASSSFGHSVSEQMLNTVFDAIVLSSRPTSEKEELLNRTRQIVAEINFLFSRLEPDKEIELDELLPLLQAVADSASAFRERLGSEDDLAGARQTLQSLEKTVSSISMIEPKGWCCYAVKQRRYPVLHCVPIDPGGLLREVLYSNFPAVLLTSATLSAGGSFSYSDFRLGVPPEADRRIFPSPFNYPEISALVLPEDVPPRDDHLAVAEYAWRIARETAEILHGRTMILFTSYRNMELCFSVAGESPLEGISLLVQGRMNRSAILERFREDSRAVIFGTASFWEGVDLPGALLHSLVIDRIPFPSPGHPLVSARMEALQSNGINSFTRLMLPEAAIRLKQGVGRLIRSETDTGVVFILDGRMRTAGYASRLLSSIPPFKMMDVREGMNFLREHVQSGQGEKNTGGSL